MKLVTLALAVVFAAACGSKQSPAPSADPPADRQDPMPELGRDAGVDGDMPGTPDPYTTGDLPNS